MDSNKEKEKKMVFYGLRHKKTKKPLGVSAVNNRDSHYYEFNEKDPEAPVWLVDDVAWVEDVLNYNTGTAGGGYNLPDIPSDFTTEDWEMFQVEI